MVQVIVQLKKEYHPKDRRKDIAVDDIAEIEKVITSRGGIVKEYYAHLALVVIPIEALDTISSLKRVDVIRLPIVPHTTQITSDDL